jgi:hypothetical protein
MKAALVIFRCMGKAILDKVKPLFCYFSSETRTSIRRSQSTCSGCSANGRDEDTQKDYKRKNVKRM